MKMTVREVIAGLEEAAADLPQGLDTPVIVMLCGGNDEDAKGSGEIEITHLVWYSEDAKVTAVSALIKGHPHVDRDEGRSTTFRSGASDADEALREWTEGQDDAS